MKTKFLYILIIVISATWSFSSCDYIGKDILERPEGTEATLDTIFSSIEYAERVLWYSYASMTSGVTRSGRSNGVGRSNLESLTDLAHNYMSWTAAPELYYSGAYNASTASVENSDDPLHWNSPATVFNYNDLPEKSVTHWGAIRNAYIFMDNIDRVPDTDDAHKKRLVAEAKTIIALQYFEMFKNYGGLTWINKVISPEDDFTIERLTAKATVDSITSLLDEAIPDLPWTISEAEIGTWAGRFTKAGAMGLKARLLLFAASPLFNSDTPYLDGDASTQFLTWYGAYDNSMWQKAADAAKAVIDAVNSQGGYELNQATGTNVADYRTAFRDAYFERTSKEVLISVRDLYNAPKRWGGNNYDVTFNYGDAKPTENYIRMFGTADGTPLTDPTSGWDEFVDPYGTEGSSPSYNRDPRLYETILVNNDNWAGRKAECYVNGAKKGREVKLAPVHATMRKFFPESNYALRPDHHWPYLRMAEIYISYAEAMNELGDQATAYTYLNMIRNRVGLKNIQDLKATWTKEELRQEIIDERAREFGYEELRWYDIARWKIESAFTKTLYKPFINKSGSTFTYTYPEITKNPRYWKTNFSPKWYLSAFPSFEVNKGYGLIQNPGW
jgi:hypothetical protein